MTDTFALEKLSTARRAIIEVKTIPEAKQLLDQVSVLVDYAKRQRLELDIQNEIAECRILTRRKLGEMLRKMADTGERDAGQGGDRKSQSRDETVKLDDLGISKSQSHRWQSEAAIPGETVREYIETTKAKEEEITVSGLNRAAKDLVSDKDTYDGDEWHTPLEYIEAARTVMGGIDLDPATCETAQEQIQADHYLTKENDALLHPWYGCVWMNPPYSMPKIEQFVDKLIESFGRGDVTEAVVLVNNSSDTRWFHKLLSRYPACFTAGRVRFWHPIHPGFATRQGQVFFYLGPDWKIDVFDDVFSEFGIVVRKYDDKQS